VRKVAENLYVLSPLALPFPYSRLARWLNRLLFLSVLRRWIAAMEFARPIVWSFLPTGMALDIIEAVEPKLTVYYCIADFRKLVRDPGKIERWERRMLRRADLVFAQGPELRDHCLRHNAHVTIFPFGVNTRRFRPEAAQPLPEDLRALPRPLIGYVGAVHRHMDIGLVETLARRRVDWSWVLVGPVYTDISRLEGLPNVHLLGAREHQALPRYIGAFDVCLIPYLQSDYTQTVFPTKLNEYLSMGKPVVSAALPEVEAFRRRHGDVVRTAASPDAFLREIDEALSEANGPFVRERIEVASEHSWARRIDAMSALMQEAIARKAAALESDWGERWVRVYRAARRRATTIAVAVMCGYAALFYTPLVWWAAAPLKVADAPAPADAAVVFAGGVGESGRPEQGYEERVQYAVALYREGLVRRLVFSSGYTYAVREAEVMRALAVALGMPAEAIVLEMRARNTYENVVETSRLLRERGWGSALVVSSPYHMRRVSLVYRRAAPDVTVRLTPVPFSRFYQSQATAGRSVDLRRIRAILHEYAALGYYWWKGYL
jgi:uncharacterized SAM-binding protein YcdF (DUF218 family)/glycosyltransferase involved in cell wall biosynthesis